MSILPQGTRVKLTYKHEYPVERAFYQKGHSWDRLETYWYPLQSCDCDDCNGRPSWFQRGYELETDTPVYIDGRWAIADIKAEELGDGSRKTWSIVVGSSKVVDYASV